MSRRLNSLPRFGCADLLLRPSQWAFRPVRCTGIEKLRLVSASVAAFVLAGGCTGNTPQPSPSPDRPANVLSQPASGDQAAAPSPAVDPADLPKDPAALADATAAYAESVRQAMARRAQPAAPEVVPPAPPPAVPQAASAPPRDQIVFPALQWLEPKEYRLSLGSYAPRDAAPTTRPAPVQTEADATLSVQIVSIGPATRPTLDLNVTTPTPAPAASDLESRIASQLRQNPKDLAAHLEAQLLEFLHNRPAPRLDALSSLDPEDREILSVLLDATANFRAAVRAEPNMLLSKKVQPLLEIADRLRGATNLRVSNLVLCRKVDGFGMYDAFEAARFEPMRSHAVIVYCEVENFSSRQGSRNAWETTLSEEIYLLNAAGDRVWTEKRQRTQDVSRARRRDFSLAKMIRLPALPAGKYALTVSVQDEQSNRLAELSIPLHIGNDSVLSTR